MHLLRAVTVWTEAGAGEFPLHFVRDREKSEVDFLLRTHAGLDLENLR